MVKGLPGWWGGKRQAQWSKGKVKGLVEGVMIGKGKVKGMVKGSVR